MSDARPIGKSNQLVQMETAPACQSISAEELALRVARLNEQQTLDPSQQASCVCERCCEFFDYRPRSQAEVERLHQTLFMTGPAVQHIHRVCDSCFDNIVGPALRNERVEMIGVTNHSHTNLALAALARG